MKRIIAVLLALVMSVISFGAMKVDSFAEDTLSANIRAKEQEIAELQSSLDWYESHKESTAGLEHCVAARVVQKNPMIVLGSGWTNDISGYIHIINPSFTDEHYNMLGFSGYVRSLGYSVMTYNGYTVWEYELVETEQYSREIMELDEKIRVAKSELSYMNSLKYIPGYFFADQWTGERTYIRLEPNMTVFLGTIEYGRDVIASETFKYTSSNKKVVSVDQHGNITTKKAGTAVITATAELTGLQAVCTVKVAAPSKDISLKKDKINISCGKKYSIKPALVPKTSNDYVYYLSSDETVATVDQKGVVKAVNPGRAYIAVMTESEIYKTLEVNVLTKNAPEPTDEYLAVKAAKAYHEDRIDPDGMLLYTAEKSKKKYLVSVYSFSETIESYINAIRSVSDTYELPCHDARYTYSVTKKEITLKEVDGSTYTGDYMKAREVHIYGGENYKSDYGDYGYRIGIGSVVNFTSTAYNSVAERVSWTSSNEYVASVDQNGTVTGKHVGVTTITCRMEGGAKDEITMSVGYLNDLNNMIIPDFIVLDIDQSLKLEGNAEDGEWTSSDPAVVTVSDDGTVTGVQTGDCEITFTRCDGETDTVSCHVLGIDESIDDYKFLFQS